MANVPFHTHEFSIPVAGETDSTAGLRDDIAMAPKGVKQSIAAEAGVTLATAAQGIKADLVSTELAGPSKISNRKDDIIDIRDWNSGGSVTGGGSGSIFTDAMNSAFAAYEGTGAIINVPPPPNGQPYKLGKVKFGETPEAQGKVRFLGSRFTQIEPAEEVEIGEGLIEISSTFFDMNDMTFTDPNNLLEVPALSSDPSGGAFLYVNAARTGLPIKLSNIQGLGGACLIRNDIADNVKYFNIEALNTRTMIHNNSGGVGNRIQGIRGQGIKFGVVLDSDTATDPARIHAEGYSISDAEILPTQSGGYGFWIRDVLLLRFSDVVVGQCGPGTISMFLDGTGVGKPVALVEGNRVWLEGGTGAPALKARGNVAEVNFEKLSLSYGGAATGVTGIDFDGVNGFSFVEGITLDPNMDRFAKAAVFANSKGVVRNANWYSGTVEENSNCQIKWETEYYPTSNQSALSEYPRAPWRSYVPVITAASGTLGTVSGVTGRFQKVGKTVVVAGKATIDANGTGSSAIFITLPYPVQSAVAGYSYHGSGREDGTTGVSLQVRANSGSSAMIIVTTNNQYPGGTGNVIQWQLQYETS